jgi:hypothetical protein
LNINNSTITLDLLNEGVNGEIEMINGVFFCVGNPTNIGRLLWIKKKRLGKIEVDLMIGKNHERVLLVMTDWACLYNRYVRLQGKTSLEEKRVLFKFLTKTK